LNGFAFIILRFYSSPNGNLLIAGKLLKCEATAAFAILGLFYDKPDGIFSADILLRLAYIYAL
jgi:hypothetical protein